MAGMGIDAAIGATGALITGLAILATTKPRTFLAFKTKFYLTILGLTAVAIALFTGASWATRVVGREWHIDYATVLRRSDEWAEAAFLPGSIGTALVVSVLILSAIAGHLKKEQHPPQPKDGSTQ